LGEITEEPLRRSGRLLLVLLFLLSASLLTFPLILHITDSVPLGTEQSASVPFLNIWTIGWNVRELSRWYSGYWDAPIFYPVPGSFAFSDPQPLSGFLGSPTWIASPALSYNSVLLAYLTLNGLAAYGLIREAGAQRPVAILGGLAVQFLPFLTNERGVLQLNAFFGPLLVLAAGLRLSRQPTARNGLFLSFSLILCFASSEYYAVGVAIPLALLLLVNPTGSERKRIMLAALAAGVLAAVLASPFLLGQSTRLQRMGFSRSTQTLSSTSASIEDYVRQSPRLRLHVTNSSPTGGSAQALSPGVLLLLGGLAGFLISLRDGNRNRWSIYLVLMTGTMLLLSFGSNFVISGFHPFEQLYQRTPILHWMRSPFRLGVFVQLGTALLAVECGHWIYQRSRKAAAAAGILVLLSLVPFPETLTPLPDNSRWVSLLPSAADLTAIHLPWAAGSDAYEFEETAAWMIGSLQGNLTIANGYSGFFPTIHRQMRTLTPLFPSESLLRVLRAQGIDLVILHGNVDSKVEDEIKRLLDQGILSEVGRDQDSWILHLPGPGIRPADEFPGRWSMRDASVAEQLILRVHAEVEDSQTYVYIPSQPPMEWLLVEQNASGKRKTRVSPLGSGLLYHGSDAWLRISTGWAPPEGSARYALYDLKDGRRIASFERDAREP